jgi:multidrug efflux pump subunit AcrA (membrane-fusion protein)
LSGNVDIRQVDLGFRAAGRIAEIPFDEGARVSVDAVLAKLDAATYESAADAARAQVGVNAAELAKQRNGNRTQDIAQAAATLEQAQAMLSRTKADFERYASLVRTDTISRSSYDLSREAFQTAQGKVAGAAEALSLQRAGARQEDIDTAAAQLGLAKAQSDKVDIDLADAVMPSWPPSPGHGDTQRRVRRDSFELPRPLGVLPLARLLRRPLSDNMPASSDATAPRQAQLAFLSYIDVFATPGLMAAVLVLLALTLRKVDMTHAAPAAH